MSKVVEFLLTTAIAVFLCLAFMVIFGHFQG